MSVYRPKKSPFYQYDFELGGNGRRFFGSTRCTNRREAEAFERNERDIAERTIKAERAAAATAVSLQMDHVAERYYQEVGKFHAGSDNTERDLNRLVEYFGPTKLLSEITDADVTALIAWRRGHRRAPKVIPKGKKAEDYPFICPSTINRSTIEVLKKLFTHAKAMWNVRFEHEPKWGGKNSKKSRPQHMLKEPTERTRELIGDEGDRLDMATRDDFADIIAFAHLTGFRKEDCVDLRWPQVNREAKQIKRLGKNDKVVTVPITKLIASILDRCQGHHPVFVFTYVAARTVRERKAGETYVRSGNRKTKGQKYVAVRDQEARIKGQRYPMTLEGLDSAWFRIREKAGVKDFRFHDFRHDVATKMLRRTGNLKLVSRLLNHSDLKTTTRYAHVLDEDIASELDAYHSETHPNEVAMQERDTESRKKSRTNESDAA